jgi:signal transduction histidine kinase
MNLSKTANPFPDAHPADVSEVESGVMVNTLTEDAINAACLGFDLQRIKDNGLNGASNEHSAVLTLNIEAARDSDWLFSVASGSWKRICLNLVLNALKYTPCGYISVTLRKKWRQQRADREGSALVELVVSLRTNHLATGLANFLHQVEDSGIGMSKEFQVRSLFRPFKQENSLTPGTGLVSSHNAMRMRLTS